VREAIQRSLSQPARVTSGVPVTTLPLYVDTAFTLTVTDGTDNDTTTRTAIGTWSGGRYLRFGENACALDITVLEKHVDVEQQEVALTTAQRLCAPPSAEDEVAAHPRSSKASAARTSTRCRRLSGGMPSEPVPVGRISLIIPAPLDLRRGIHYLPASTSWGRFMRPVAAMDPMLMMEPAPASSMAGTKARIIR
jgi:hypothetical protein